MLVLSMISVRLGEYGVLSYGSNSNPLRLGHFQLSAGGNYSFFNNGGGLVGSGTYKYDNVNKNVQWLSGPFNKNISGAVSLRLPVKAKHIQ